MPLRRRRRWRRFLRRHRWHPEGGVSPIQLIGVRQRSDRIRIAGIAPGATIVVPRLAVGVHHGGDWHEAIDFYARTSPAALEVFRVPAWLRDQGAIYSFSGGGAGAILMALPVGNLADGAIWTTWAKDDGPWRDGKDGRFAAAPGEYARLSAVWRPPSMPFSATIDNLMSSSWVTTAQSGRRGRSMTARGRMDGMGASQNG